MSERAPEPPTRTPRPSRRWRTLVAAGAAAISLYALVGFFVVPRIARTQIEKQARALLHREATVARVRFNPFTLAAVVEGLDLKDRDGAELFHLDRLTADFQVSGIFRRAFRFREIVVLGPRAAARITADGRLSIADLFEKSAEEKPAAPGSSLPRALVDRFTVRGGAARFVDESRSPVFVEALGPIDLELHDLTTIPDESGDHSITLGLGEGARIHWSGRQTVEPLKFEGKFEITNIRLPHLWEYLAATNPLMLRDGKGELTCSYDIHKGADGRLAVEINDAGAAVRDLAVRPRGGGDDWLVVPLVEVLGAEIRWPEARAEVKAIRVKGPRALAWLDKDQTLNWQAAIPAATAPASESNPWTAKIASVEVLEASAHIEDRSFQPNIVVDVTDVALKLENLTNDLKAPIPMTLSARINGAGEASASGTVVADPPTADLDIALSALDLKPFNPYAIHFPWADIRRGTAAASGKLHVGNGKPAITFDGAVALKDFQIAGAGLDRIVACDRAAAEGVGVTIFPEKIRVAKLTLDGAFADLDIDRDGNVNLKKIFATKDAVPATAPIPSEPLDLAIRLIAIENATAEFTDESLILPFDTKIHSINGSIKDLSTKAAAAARLDLEGRIADTGYFKSDGTLHVGAPLASTDVGVLFRGVDMPELTPYAAQFAGYSIAKGVLDVDVRYKIQDGRLVGEHRVVAKDLTLGPKVEGAKGPGLPVRLAIALLKDKDGTIDLEVPIEGTIDSPEFNYKSVFWQAFKTILGNVAKAPFLAIGRMFGGDRDDLELVGFAAGQSDLPAPEKEKLAKMGAELSQKAELTLEIEGRFDPVTDVVAIRRVRLEQRIDARRETTPDLEAILQALYSETFSPERLESERQKFQADAAGFYDALRSQMLAADVVSQSTLDDLARARAAAIVAAITAPGGLDASRVKALDPATVKRKKQGSELVPSEMTLSAGD